MNRFEDTLRRDLDQIADRATPSPDAWAQIQSRIADQEPTQETEIIMLTDNTLTRRRWPLVAGVAAAIVALVITLAAVNRDTEPEIPADNPEPTPTAPAVDPEAADEPEPGDDATTGEPIDPPVLDLPAEGEAVPPGRYAPSTLGLPVTFEVPDTTASPWQLQVSNAVTINVGNGDGFVVLTRVGSLYDAEQSQGPTTGLGRIPADDLDGWIDANDVTVLERRDDTIGGRSAVYRRVAAPAGDGTEPCPADLDPCVSLASASADLQDVFDGVSINVFGENPHSLWFVELDDFEPLAIWVSAVGTDPDAWLAEITPLIESIELGDPAPAVEGGIARLPLRQQFFATATTPRGEGTVLEDGSIERIVRSVLTGDLTGEMVGTGIELSPANGYDDIVFTGTIDGIGTGTLTMYQEWTADQNSNIAFTTTITDASGDFAGITGRVITTLDNPDESGPVPVFTSRLTFQLAIPTAG